MCDVPSTEPFEMGRTASKAQQQHAIDRGGVLSSMSYVVSVHRSDAPHGCTLLCFINLQIVGEKHTHGLCGLQPLHCATCISHAFNAYHILWMQTWQQQSWYGPQHAVQRPWWNGSGVKGL